MKVPRTVEPPDEREPAGGAAWRGAGRAARESGSLGATFWRVEEPSRQRLRMGKA